MGQNVSDPKERKQGLKNFHKEKPWENSNESWRIREIYEREIWREFKKTREPTLFTALRVKKNPGIRVIHTPTCDWPRRRRERRSTKQSTEGGNAFDGRDRRSMQIKDKKPFRNL